MLTLVCTLAYTSVCFADNTTADLKKQMVEMIQKLESEKVSDIQSFIETYALPEDLKKLKSREDRFKSIVTQFMKRKRDKLKKVLEAALKLEPQITEDKMTYTFKSDDLPRTLNMVWVDKDQKFYIKN